MIDTGYITLIGNYEDKLNSYSNIEWRSESINLKSGRITKAGKLKNMQITLSNHFLSIKGSIAEYIGGNTESYSFQEILEGYRNLGNTIGIDLLNAKFNRLDLAENIMVDRKPIQYFSLLGIAKGANRFIEKNSLYYNFGYLKYEFYDKILETICKDSKPLDNVNCMRFEVRLLNYYLKKVAKDLDIKHLTIGHLDDTKICKYLINKWLMCYNDIIKVTNYEFEYENIKSPKDFYSALINMGIESSGGLIELIGIIQNSDNKHLSPVQKVRIKKRLSSNESKKINKVKSNLIVELDEKVNKIANNKILSLYEK